jgi:uncharacterized protein (TIGR04255 family)
MAIRFPEKEDLPLRHPPLKQVICQVRFAPLLVIAEGLPVSFQVALRGEFPAFGMKQGISIESRGTSVSVQTPPPPEYTFRDARGELEASLGINFVALTTSKYPGWDAFIGSMGRVLSSLESSYGPILATRIGLRYINELPVTEAPPTTPADLIGMLNSELSCVLLNRAWTTPLGAGLILLLGDDGGRLALRLALESEPIARLIVDLDYFVELAQPEERSKDALIEDLHRGHGTTYNAFRWMMDEGALRKFEPVHPEVSND